VYDYGINDPHFVLGPKVPRANEYHTIVATETQRCISGETMPEEACQNIKNQVDALH
jgi:multiple sugar transport system substrate-binding protein